MYGKPVRTYFFAKCASKTGRGWTHTFHEKRHTEEIDFFLINKNVDSALYKENLCSGNFEDVKDVNLVTLLINA